MGKLKIITTPLEGLYVVETEPFMDHRGIWARIFCENELREILQNRHIVNINLSKTSEQGTVRGMHYQLPPMAEMKLIRCTGGRIFDVAVDLRKNSPTYLHWHGEELSGESMKMFVIPEGFAHGFQALTDNIEMIYLHTEFYSQELERGVRYNDPAIGIQWPLKPTNLSERDQKHPMISNEDAEITITGNKNDTIHK
ncbi:dTDP-4-dehydrorhamnose 3,5-epimerase [Methanorbis rubei]|uniref:dTDP-4-dehydrorhamnose 3,5-epimerase n=1 Tax=Methanorbis rubei TaxID=3028300 RepID=A0AAE4MGV2_9EURY|nr:dTDP-4-dehydrorhamnose 3,5-epimerase [Methanocorpusculaceae archaeon Cs1]